MSLHDLVNDPERDRRSVTTALRGAGAWGTVTWVDTTAKRLRCTVDEFDGGELYDFGPVTYGDLSGDLTDVAVGDRVLLLAVGDGDEPAAALKFPQ